MTVRAGAVSVGAWIITLLAVCASFSSTTAASQSALARGGAGPQAVPADSLRVVLLGTGMGPLVNLQQFGASTLVEAGGKRLLFDCGRGTTIRLTQVGVPLGSVSRLFLTHLHSDHVIQIPDLLLAGWVGMTGRKVPLDVWGPEGTRAMMSGLEKAFEFDIHIRGDLNERLPVEGIRVRSHDIREGVVFDEDGVRVTAFLVDHEPITPAFGYRVDYRGRSVALSGDTRMSENLVKFATDVDVLIHEAIDPVAVRARSKDPALAERVIALHTTAEQAGEVFARVKPRLAVYSHAPNSEAVIAQTRKSYTGPLEGAEDLLTIDVGEQVSVRRFGQ